jgi:hypothetical protein
MGAYSEWCREVHVALDGGYPRQTMRYRFRNAETAEIARLALRVFFVRYMGKGAIQSKVEVKESHAVLLIWRGENWKSGPLQSKFDKRRPK